MTHAVEVTKDTGRHVRESGVIKFSKETDERLWRDFLITTQALYRFHTWKGKGLSRKNRVRRSTDKGAKKALPELQGRAVTLHTRFVNAYDEGSVSPDLVRDAKFFMRSVRTHIPLGIPTHDKQNKEK